MDATPVRVLYQFDVRDEQDERFEQVWAEVTRSIRARREGARGSLLLRRGPGRYLAIARWRSRADWEAASAAPAPADGSPSVRELADVVVVDVLDEVSDLTEPDGSVAASDDVS